MIVRIVRMTFRTEEVINFLELFKSHQKQIRNFPGCRHLELLRDTHKPEVMSTYSLWDSEEALNAYRDSEVFAGLWPKTKALFAEKPIAHSYEQLIRVEKE
jgi:quinol monooxygenase YgiN